MIQEQTVNAILVYTIINYCKPGLELRKFIELLYALTMQSDSLHT